MNILNADGSKYLQRKNFITSVSSEKSSVAEVVTVIPIAVPNPWSKMLIPFSSIFGQDLFCIAVYGISRGLYAMRNWHLDCMSDKKEEPKRKTLKANFTKVADMRTNEDKLHPRSITK